MDINQNQKAVSPTLRLTLEEDLYWDSERADSRIKALRSSVIKELSNSVSGPLYNKISIGEDAALLSSNPFANALLKSGLLPFVKGNQYDPQSAISSLYNVNNHDYKNEMPIARKNVVQFVNLCYEYVEDKFPEIFNREQYFVMSNRGTYAFVNLIGSLNSFETHEGNLNVLSTPNVRFMAIQNYIHSLLDQIMNLSKKEEEAMLLSYGTGADIKWLRFFQTLVNRKFPKYNPVELVDWNERQDVNLQDEGRKLGVDIERFMKSKVIEKLKQLFGDNWDIEIGKIQRECEARAKEEIEKQYKEGLGRKEIPWTDMFYISDYKSIIEKYWTKSPNEESAEFVTFQKEFSIDIGQTGANRETKWISLFNSYRNLWAHEGSKEKGLNKEEVQFLKRIHDKFF